MYRENKIQIHVLQLQGGLKSFEPQHEDCITSFCHSSTRILDALENTSENFNHFGLSIIVRKSFMSADIKVFVKMENIE